MGTLRRGILILSLFFIYPTYSVADSADDVRSWVEAHVPQMMRDSSMPGFSIAVVQDGTTIYAAGFGARDPKKGLPATADTLYGIGSVTKSFVAISILQLAAQGHLDIDDPVSKHIPLEIGLPGTPMTIRHFMSHSSGLPSLASSSVLLGRGLGEDTGIPLTSTGDFYRFVNGAQDEIAFEPGEHYFYNNAAWRMLGAVVQNVSGMPFHEYVTRYVIRPLGMQRTTFDTNQLYLDTDHMIPHRQTDEGPIPTPFPYPNPAEVGDFGFLSAAGGISSSVNEMTAYLNMLINLGEYDGKQLISKNQMEDMQTLHIREPDDYYGIAGYGFGLGVVPDFLGTKMIEHGGSIAVSTARISLIPEHKIGVVVMGNSGGMDYAKINDSIMAILLGSNPADAIPSVGIRARMSELTGKYAVYQGIESLEITEKGGLLYTKDGENLTPLVPEDELYQETAFNIYSNGRRTPVVFRQGANGRRELLIGRYVYHQQ